MTARLYALAASLALGAALLGPAGASGEELGVWLSREEAARLAGEAGKVPALQDQVRSLEAEGAELRAGRDAALKLAEISEKLEAAQKRLTALAEEEREAWKAKAERLEKDKGKGRLWLLVQARGSAGALIGGTIGSPTGIGLPLGAAAGALIGGVAGAIEALVVP